MKLKEPFAGYQLANGHFIYHLAFFAASYMVDYHDEDPMFETAFLFIRYSHLIVIILGLINDSIIMFFSRQDASKAFEDQSTKDGFILMTKAFATAEVVIFQSSIFYAQFAIGTQILQNQDPEAMRLLDHSNESWLAIEITSFYLIILGAVLYIALTQISNLIWTNQVKEDMYRKTDFIKYHQSSINWYSFNTILFGMPIALLILQQAVPRNEAFDDDGDYWYLMAILGVTHFVQFCFIRQLMKVQSRDQLYSSSSREKTDDDDDDYQRVQDQGPNQVQNQDDGPVEKRFNYSCWWFWIISFIVEIIVLVIYFQTDANELYFIFWIPTDGILFLCMFFYYLIVANGDKARIEQEKKISEKLAQDIQKKLKIMLAKSFQKRKSLEQQSEEASIIEEFALQEEKVATFDLSNDTYAIAFKAMHRKFFKSLSQPAEVRYNAFHSAIFVFSIQSLMVLFVVSVIQGNSFAICMPINVYSLGARFVCSILMHLQVEADLRQGIFMMKYVSNHAKDFNNPWIAFFIGFMQSMGGLAAEFLCIIYLTSITSTMDTVIKFMALASIAKVDDMYAGALASDYCLKKKVSLQWKVKKRDMNKPDAEKSCKFYVMRFIFKLIRLVYCSYIFYFMPFTCIIIPYLYLDPECLV